MNLNLDENYYLRRHFLKNKKVPMQSMIKDKMSESLANVYFNSMPYKLKLLAGLEPEMQGGGKDKLLHPSDLIAGRACMKPMKKEYLQRLGHSGIAWMGEKLLLDHRNEIQDELKTLLEENGITWKKHIAQAWKEQWDDSSKLETRHTTEKLRRALKEFEMLFMTSLTELENLLRTSSLKSILDVKNKVHSFMKERHACLLQQQQTMIQTRFSKKLIEAKYNMKHMFITNFEKERRRVVDAVHDIYIEKQRALETMRKQMQCQNLACKMYIASVERYNCEKNSQKIKDTHTTTLNKLRDSVAMRDLELKILTEKEKKSQELNKLWQDKVCRIIKYFQIFVSYCLKTVPEQANFFLNLEKMIVVHLNETLENKQHADFFSNEEEDEQGIVDDKVPKKTKPFVVFGNFKPKLFDENLCPRVCSKSDLPVLVVNKKHIYAACDNFKVFSEKLREFVNQVLNKKTTMKEIEFSNRKRIKYSNFKEFLDVKLESSLLKVIQSEISNILNVTPAESCMRVSDDDSSCASIYLSGFDDTTIIERTLNDVTSKLMPASKPTKLLPPQPKPIPPCECAWKAKKKLINHLPPYMFGQKKYPLDMFPRYEACSTMMLQELTSKKVNKKPSKVIGIPKFVDTGIQCTDTDYENICFCFSDYELEKLQYDVIEYSKMFDSVIKKQRMDFVGGSMAPNFLDEDERVFAAKRAASLKKLLRDNPSFKDLLFSNGKCE